MESSDRLQVVNDELRARADERSPWLPLESNPVLFTSFSHSIGLARTWRWLDVLGLDAELLSLLPDKCAAFILLFPCSRARYAARREEEQRILAQPYPTSDIARGAFFVRQHAAFGNACGTIACMHALANVAIPQATGTPLRAFREENGERTPDERGTALHRSAALKCASDSAALAPVAQTVCPARDGEDLDHHFVAFVSVGGRVVELDGTKLCPIDHFAVRNDDSRGFVNAASRVIRDFISHDPGSIEYSLMALCNVGD